jgi:hypothetical protein
MAMMTRDIHCSLQHDNREGYAWNPADEAENSEGRENGEDYSGTPQMFVEIVNRRSNSQANVQNPSDPDKLLGEVLRKEEVCPGEDESDGKNKGE